MALSFHSAGVTWVMQDLQLQGMATHSAGYAATGPQGTAALGYEMVNGVLWPSTVGQPGHLVRDRKLLRCRGAQRVVARLCHLSLFLS